MQLEQSFSVSAAPDAVWQAFHDPALLVSCLPGASLRGPVQDGKLPLSFKVKLGPIAAAFAGEGALALDEAARSGVFSGQAADGRSNSRVKGEARFRAGPADAGTRVAVEVSFAITGSLAQFSREGIVRALADQLTQQFAANLQERLAAGHQGEAAAGDAAAGTSATAAAEGAGSSQAALAAASAGPAASASAAARPAPEAPSLNLLALLGALLKGYWQRLTGKRAS